MVVKDQYLENLCKSIPWSDPRNAASAACELIREIAPRVNCEDYFEVTQAREQLAQALELLQKYIDRLPIEVDYGSPNDPYAKRLYWFVNEYRHRVANVCAAAGHLGSQSIHRDRWLHASSAIRTALEFLLKFAAGNTYAVVEPDGAAGDILWKISGTIIPPWRRHVPDATTRIVHWRVIDACSNRPIPEEIVRDFKPAFEAAWMAEEYAFAYSLVKDL